MRKYIYFIIMFLLIPVNVYALTGSLSITCQSTEVSPGDVITCNVTGTSDDVVTAFEGKLTLDNKASIMSFEKIDDKWNSVAVNNDGLTLIAATGRTDISGKFNIGKLTLKINDNATGKINLKFSRILFGDKDYNDVLTGIVSNETILNVKAKSNTQNNNENVVANNSDNVANSSNNVTNNSNDNKKKEDETDNPLYLSDLVITGYDINFKKDTFDYSLKINDEDSLVIKPVTDDENVSYTISGNENLDDGSVILITLNDKDNHTSEYRISIVKNIDEKVFNDTVVTTEKDENNVTSIIFISIIALLIIINIVRIVLRNKRTN